MASGEIALLKRRGGILLGLVLQGADGRTWALQEDGLHFRISQGQVVWPTGTRVEEGQAAEWLRRSTQLAGTVDLSEAWQVVQGEVPWLSLRDLAELIWGPAADDLRRAALLLALHTAPLPLFALHGQEIAPIPPEEVERQQRRQEHARHLEEEERGFVGWLGGGAAPDPWTERHQGWLDAVRGFVVHGQGFSGARQAVRLLRQVGDAPDFQRLGFDLLVQRGVLSQDEPLVVLRLGVPTEFPEEVMEDARRLAAAAPSAGDGRRDLASLEAFTVDEASTADMDDALSLQHDGDGYLLGVHVTDVAALVPPGSLTDLEARRRASSLYLPEGVIPMLPPPLSLDVGSLLPGAPRLTVSVLARLGPGFQLLDWEVVRSRIVSLARLSYEEADRALDEPGHPLGRHLQALGELAEHLGRQRVEAGAVELGRPEVKVAFEPGGRARVWVEQGPTRARRLVAEMMVLANRLLAEYCRGNGIPTIYRTQEQVSMEEMAETTVEAVRRYQVLRRARPAAMSLHPGPHALLGVPVYLQATSPLRRYPDLMVQRQIVSFLEHGQPLYARDHVAEVAYQMEGYLRALARAEEERRRYWVLKALSERTGEAFSAVVLEGRDGHAQLEVADGLLRARAYLGPGPAIGETVRLRLESVDLWRLEAHLVREPEPLAEAVAASPVGGRGVGEGPQAPPPPHGGVPPGPYPVTTG